MSYLIQLVEEIHLKPKIEPMKIMLGVYHLMARIIVGEEPTFHLFWNINMPIIPLSGYFIRLKCGNNKGNI